MGGSLSVVPLLEINLVEVGTRLSDFGRHLRWKTWSGMRMPRGQAALTAYVVTCIECKAKAVSLNEAAAYVAMRPDSESLQVVLVQA